MKPFLSFMLFIMSAPVFGQTTAQQEIDQQVWQPFTEAIINQNVDAFIALHSKDVIRAEIDSKKVFGFETYKKNMQENWPKWKEALEKNKLIYSFELRFIERIAHRQLAYEIGYFKNETVNANGEKRVAYGKFHVTLRKENGTWKILVDSDTNEGGGITDEMFEDAKPLGL